MGGDAGEEGGDAGSEVEGSVRKSGDEGREAGNRCWGVEALGLVGWTSWDGMGRLMSAYEIVRKQVLFLEQKRGGRG